MRSAAITTSLALSADAVAMARQLADPDGKVVFSTHPLKNEPDPWTVRGQHQYGADPVRQLLTYGLASVAPCVPVHKVDDPWEESGFRAYPWQIVLTRRGRAWLDEGASTRINPPMSVPGRRARRMMRRAA